MGDLLGVSVDELVSLIKRKKSRLPFEIGAFVSLETCEALLKGPARVALHDVRVSDDGAVSVYAPPNSATGEEAAKSVVALLAHILVAAGPGVPPVLVDLVENGPSDGRWDLHRLRDELEAALVPLNRGAARRVLSRMLREAFRDGSHAKRASQFPEAPEEPDVDAELDALVGLEGGAPAAAQAGAPRPRTSTEDHAGAAPARNSRPTPQVLYAPPADRGARPGDKIWDSEPGTQNPALPVQPRRADDSMATTMDRGVSSSIDPARLDADIDDMLTRPRSALTAEEAARIPLVQPAAPVAPLPAEIGPPRGLSGPVIEEPTNLERPNPIRRSRNNDIDLSAILEQEGKKKNRSLLYAVGFLLLSGLLLAAVAILRPDAVDRFIGNETPEEREAARLARERSEEQERILSDHAARYGDLVVDVSPQQAQVLLFIGRGPATTENVPVGRAHEFIAIADGKSPGRTVLPPDISLWDTTDDEAPRFELAMQAGTEDMPDEELMLGDTRLTQDMGAPDGRRGSVRVVTNPPGAKVYHLIGFTPHVRVSNIRADQGHELLIWAPEYRARRVTIGPSDWVDEDGTQTAHVDFELEPLDPDAVQED